MSKCPQCKDNITHLIHSARIVAIWQFSLDDNGNADYSTSELMDEPGENQQWECPECSAVLFENEKDAVIFLRGRGKKK